MDKSLANGTQRDGRLSIILLSYYSQNRIRQVFDRTRTTMESENIDFEFIIVDDGSKDNSMVEALKLEEADSRVRAFQLSRNFTTHYAKFAGFSVSRGDCAVTIPDDFQLPLDLVVLMYRHWQQGHMLVVPYRKRRSDAFLGVSFSKAYYTLMNWFSDVEFPPGGADVFLADREIVDILTTSIPPRNTSSTIEALRLGFDPLFIPFERPHASATKSRWTFRKRIRLAVDTFFSFSAFPIKLISMLGFSSFIFSILLILVSLYLKLSGKQSIGGVSMPGWTSTVIITAFFSGLILFSLGMLAEYIWRIFEEVKGRPGYIIRKREWSDETRKSP